MHIKKVGIAKTARQIDVWNAGVYTGSIEQRWRPRVSWNRSILVEEGSSMAGRK
jgi:hypothetical protein